MRGFISSVALLLAAAALTAPNGFHVKRAADEICLAILAARGESCEAVAPKIKSCVSLVEKKRKLLRVSLKANELKELLSKLAAAYSHCLRGSEEEKDACLSEALLAVREWKKGETPSLWNVL